jgi:ABC-type uncharacterized transport system permease subunit
MPKYGSARNMSVFQFTNFFLYIIAGALFAAVCLPRYAAQRSMLLIIAFATGLTGLLWHTWTLWFAIAAPDGIVLSIENAASFIGLLLAIIGLIGAAEKSLRGLAGGLFVLAAVAALLTTRPATIEWAAPMTWQIQSHIFISLLAYGLLTVGVILALYALAQERRLQAGKFSELNQLFAPLETTERLLFGITTAGFLVLLIAVSTGVAFVDDLFAQHLVHKTAFSILALVLFGTLLIARWLAGWRGKRAIYLYLWGFLFLCLAYFGSRFILEEVLGRSWS